MNFEEKLNLLEKELAFSIKYAAKIAALHQYAKDDVKMLREQIKETREIAKERIEQEKKKLEEMEEVKVE